MTPCETAVAEGGENVMVEKTYDTDLQVGGEATEDGALDRNILALGCLGRHNGLSGSWGRTKNVCC